MKMRNATNTLTLKKGHIRVLGFLLANQGRSFTQLEIAKSVGQVKSYKNLRGAIQELAEQGVIVKREVGASVLCSLNFKVSKTLDYLAYVENVRKYELFKMVPAVREIGERLIAQIRLHTPFFSLLLFGSYAKGTFHERSDADLVVIAEKKHHAAIGNEFTHLQAIYTLKLNFFVMAPADYERMLKSKEEINVGKESLRGHVLLYGTELYYQVVRDALW